MSAYACVFAVPILLAVGLAVDGRHAIALTSLKQAGALAYMAVVVTALAFVLWYSGVGRLGVQRAGLFAGIVPISALLSAAAIGESSLTLVRLLGATAVAAGVTRHNGVRLSRRPTAIRLGIAPSDAARYGAS